LPLAAGRNNLDELANQVRRHAPQMVSVPDEAAAVDFAETFFTSEDRKIEIVLGEKGAGASCCTYQR